MRVSNLSRSHCHSKNYKLKIFNTCVSACKIRHSPKRGKEPRNKGKVRKAKRKEEGTSIGFLEWSVLLLLL